MGCEMKIAKTESVGFRCSIEMKRDIMKRSLDLKMQPSEYIYGLVEKDLLSKTNELPEREQTFIEKQFQLFADKLLSFLIKNVDTKIEKLQHRTTMAYITCYYSLLQSTQSAVRSKEILSYLLKDDKILLATDDNIKIKVKAIQDDIKKKYDSGDY